jgi:hypothetical protein
VLERIELLYDLEIHEARRGNRLKLGLALHIGFLRMSGRLLDAFRVIPSVLWRHRSVRARQG